MPEKRERLRKLIESHALSIGPLFTLSTGQKSKFYFDCKKVTLRGEGLALIADLMLERINTFERKPAVIGGLTMGADFIVAGVIMRAFETGHKTTLGSIVRQEKKSHGTGNIVENRLEPGLSTVVIDDVVTSGKSTLTACAELEKAGYHIVGVIALVDRAAGGLVTIQERYPNTSALFCVRDFHQLADRAEDAGSKTALTG